MNSALPPCPPLSGLILAGGAGRRAQGADKAWLTWQNQPVILHVLERLLPQVQQLWVSANRSLTRYNELPGCAPERIIRDDWPDYLGPLAGIASCLSQMPAGWVLVTPVDTPRLPRDLGIQLWRGLQQELRAKQADGALTSAKMAVATIRTAEGTEEAHWLHLLVHTDAAEGLRARLTSGQRRVRDWCLSEQAVPVLIDAEPECFANLNTDSDYKAPR